MKMPPRVSLRDISEAVGVSVSTVSRALNGSDRVSVLTKQAVAEAAAQLAIAGSANGRTRTQPMIGLTHSHRSSGSATRSLDVILEQVLGGIEVACLQAGYIPYPWQRSSLLLTDEGDPFFKAVSGVIMSGGIVDRAVVESMQARGLPVVIIGGHVPDMGVVSVAADGQRGAYLAVRHLVELGHRRIGLVNGPDQTYTSFEKRAGYLTAIVDANFVPNPDCIRARDGYRGFDAEAGEALTEELLDLPEPPTAIVYAADQMAEAGYRVCHRRE
ncbi:MAG: LacI family DNA-binding transcriptional regulator, partial [Thermomicrobiales bacterium]